MSEQAPENNAPKPESETNRWPSPRIYVASLSDYTNGVLHGTWIEAAQDEVDLQQDVINMLKCSPSPIAEEWAIHDYDGFGALRLEEYESLKDVARVATGIGQHGPAFAAWASLVGIDSERLDDFDSAYMGEWESGAAWAEESLDDLGLLEPFMDALPPMLRPYVRIDFEGYFRDLVANGDISVVEKAEGGMYVFWD